MNIISINYIEGDFGVGITVDIPFIIIHRKFIGGAYFYTSGDNVKNRSSLDCIMSIYPCVMGSFIEKNEKKVLTAIS